MDRDINSLKAVIADHLDVIVQDLIKNRKLS